MLSLSAGSSCFVQPGSTCTNPNIASVNLLKAVDDASPKLFLAIATGVSYATANITFWQAPTTGTSNTKTYTVFLTQASLQAVQTSGGEGVTPIESLSLGFVSMGFQDNLNGAVGCYNVPPRPRAAPRLRVELTAGYREATRPGAAGSGTVVPTAACYAAR